MSNNKRLWFLESICSTTTMPPINDTMHGVSCSWSYCSSFIIFYCVVWFIRWTGISSSSSWSLCSLLYIPHSLRHYNKPWLLFSLQCGNNNISDIYYISKITWILLQTKYEREGVEVCRYRWKFLLSICWVVMYLTLSISVKRRIV